MSDVIGSESKSLEFYVFSDGSGVNEIRFSPDVQFVMATLLGVLKFVADSLEDTSGVKLLEDLTEVMRAMEAAEAAGQFELNLGDVDGRAEG